MTAIHTWIERYLEWLIPTKPSGCRGIPPPPSLPHPMPPFFFFIRRHVTCAWPPTPLGVVVVAINWASLAARAQFKGGGGKGEGRGTNDSTRSHSVLFALIRSKVHFNSDNQVVKIFLPVHTYTVPESVLMLRHRLFVLRASIKLFWHLVWFICCKMALPYFTRLPCFLSA